MYCFRVRILFRDFVMRTGLYILAKLPFFSLLFCFSLAHMISMWAEKWRFFAKSQRFQYPQNLLITSWNIASMSLFELRWLFESERVVSNALNDSQTWSFRHFGSTFLPVFSFNNTVSGLKIIDILSADARKLFQNFQLKTKWNGREIVLFWHNFGHFLYNLPDRLIPLCSVRRLIGIISYVSCPNWHFN